MKSMIDSEVSVAGTVQQIETMMLKAGAPLSEAQGILLTGALAVWLAKFHALGMERAAGVCDSLAEDSLNPEMAKAYRIGGHAIRDEIASN
jgi:hypothetical protein